MTAGSQSSSVNTFVVEKGAMKATSAHVAFDVRIEGAHSSASMELANIRFASDYGVGIGVRGGGKTVYVFEYSAKASLYEEPVVSTGFPLATWVRITLDVSLIAEALKFQRDDRPTEAFQGPLTPLDSEEVDFALGIPYTSVGASAWKLRLDNIVLDSD